MAVEGFRLAGRNRSVGGVDVEDENVNSGAAVESVGAILAFQPVGIGAAKEGIVAAASE